MRPTITTQEKRERIENDTKEFLENGGKIQKVGVVVNINAHKTKTQLDTEKRERQKIRVGKML